MAVTARQAPGGVHCLPVPTPFAVGAVNTYLLEGDPLVLVDSGPNSATSLSELVGMLRACGHELTDVDLLVVTHQHCDHLGLTRVLAEHAEAEIACLDVLAPYLEDWERRSEADDDHAHQLMLRHGIEPRVATALHEVARRLRPFGASARVDRTFRAGELVRLGGRDLRVLHRPGHSPTDTVFHDEHDAFAIAGDHLLSHVSSNALLTRPLDAGAGQGRTRPLIAYRESLLATRTLGAELFLGGHGAPVTDAHVLIDQRIRDQDARAERLLGILRSGPRSAHDLATALWGEVAITQAYLTLSEILGHLDLLLDAGLIVEDGTSAVVRFQVAD